MEAPLQAGVSSENAEAGDDEGSDESDESANSSGCPTDDDDSELTEVVGDLEALDF
jgi:hypothetical protein